MDWLDQLRVTKSAIKGICKCCILQASYPDANQTFLFYPKTLHLTQLLVLLRQANPKFIGPTPMATKSNISSSIHHDRFLISYEVL